MAQEQRIVRFSGTVQGVGFRYTARHTAGGYDVTGYVKNLPDGRVECVLEGDSCEIDRFLVELADRMGGYIGSTQQQTAPYSGRFDGFDVRF